MFTKIIGKEVRTNSDLENCKIYLLSAIRPCTNFMLTGLPSSVILTAAAAFDYFLHLNVNTL